ncbi:MAG: glycosyltransferase family 39 protein [Ruminococcus sp.]|nr:glycosyltransferase family 39 protein [Ruminococcus sp.]
MTKFISKMVDIGFGTLFLIATIIALAGSYLILNNIFGFAAISMVLIVGSALLICYLLHRAEKCLKTRDKLCVRIIYILPIVLLIFQILFVLLVDYTPRNDLSHVCKGAENFVKYGIDSIHNGLPERHQHYFYVYPNNHMLLMIISGLYKISYELTGEVSNFLPTVLNIVSLNLAYIFMIASARLIYDPAKTVICAIRGLMFVPIITYAHIFYTDSFGMLFVSLGIYLYLKFRKECNFKKQILWLVSCGSVIAVGYKMKGSLIVLLAAIIIDVIIHKSSIKAKLAKIATLVTVFSVIVLLVSMTIMSVFDFSKEELEKYQFPMIHWVMMTADKHGGYNVDDFYYTKSFDGTQSKTDADIKRLEEKLRNQGVSGFGKHIVIKAWYTWSDGRYMSSYYYKDSKFLNSKAFYVIAGALHFALMFLILQSFIAKWRKRTISIDKNMFLKICLCGLFVFLLLWEARNRYCISFMALFAMIQSDPEESYEQKRG